jgi:hypothetical protein
MPKVKEYEATATFNPYYPYGDFKTGKFKTTSLVKAAKMAVKKFKLKMPKNTTFYTHKKHGIVLLKVRFPGGSPHYIYPRQIKKVR